MDGELTRKVSLNPRGMSRWGVNDNRAQCVRFVIVSFFLSNLGTRSSLGV
jgi:hypothetical protein